MDEIKWCELPPSTQRKSRSGVRKELVAALRTRPGEWAQYAPHDRHGQNTGTMFKRDFPGVEATSRIRPDGQFDVFVRWVGNGSEPS